MRIIRIYHPEVLEINSTIPLSNRASHYVSHVLRLRTGASLQVFDGKGHEFQSTITAITKKQVIIAINNPIHNKTESPLAIHLGQAIAKGDKMDFIIQKSVELGVADITPLLTERCDVKLNAERKAKKLLHWRNIAISACEQCGRSVLPTIHEPKTLTDWLTQQTIHTGFTLAPTAQLTIQTWQKSNKKTIDDVHLVIGPEGGLSDTEINLAHRYNFNDISLGPRILRTETAGLVVISMLQSTWGDL